MQPQIPLTRDLVLIGGGHTHALVLRMWGMRPLPGVRLTLINPAPTAAYSGMLPGHIAGHYPREALQIDLVQLARHAGARLILGRAAGIDRAARRVIVPGRPDVAYDIASIDIGITAEMPRLPGFSDFAVPAKPLDAFADRWEAYVGLRPAGAAGARVAVVGAGVAGVELALAARHRLGSEASVTLVERDRALAALGRGAGRALRAHLDRARITLIEEMPAAAVEPDGVRLADGQLVPADFVIGTAAARAPGWLATTGLPLKDGFVMVGPTLRSTGDPAIFAAGDIAHLSHAPRPKAGVFAVRQAPVLLRNLGVALTGKGRMRRYRPQSDYLKLISTGSKHAVADKWGLPLDGAWLWRCKDRIDRRFMAKFHELPAMDPPALPARVAAGVREELGRGKPLCGGCGAKVGQADLKAALAGLPAPHRPDVISGPGDDAAVLAHGKGQQVITTDHVRAFTEDPWLLARITAIHAMGDVWSMGARPQAALAQVILPRMSPRLQAETLREIMAAAAETFGVEGADVVGGHTSLGAELTIGFTVTGLSAGAALAQSDARPGDWLILTKPIGTGVILAAEMARAAPGDVVAGALASMARTQGAAARILGPEAHAMTDITGFGLAGHLMTMLEASDTAARISLRHVPLLPGAEALAAAGHGSTLLPANRAVMARMFLTESPRADLLFDPQTGGGLLAAVPAEAAMDLVRRLRDAGEPAAVIGELTEGPAFLTVED
ncbi:selenide, water dikinase SelD [Defluviimonas sp. D31]|uniref:selenide, water dikinase SelD n=1 Tax=Defluviimonas sp. D31 TaxID=3083253 RepID=UPI00296E3991|nr:selenide, water dikinase SelD [Defluviimonas sp. D31]MDW4548364.1 selenide, water dikinase SelD [Defluviimonas sp. D31]